MTGPLGYIWRKPAGGEVVIAPEEIVVVRDAATLDVGLTQAEALNNLAEAIRDLTAAVNRTDEMSSQPQSQPGPAKGLHTQIRPNDAYRRRGPSRGQVGFTPPWQEDQ